MVYTSRTCSPDVLKNQKSSTIKTVKTLKIAVLNLSISSSDHHGLAHKRLSKASRLSYLYFRNGLKGDNVSRPLISTRPGFFRDKSIFVFLYKPNTVL